MKVKFWINSLKIFGIIRSMKIFLKNNFRIFNINNTFLIKSKNLKHVTLKVSGINNRILIEKGVRLRELNINISGNNNMLEIKNNTFIQKSSIIIDGNNNKTFLGFENNIYGLTIWQFEDNGLVSLGNNCLFAYNTEIRNTDSHPIYNLKTGERINLNKDIIIKDRVWVGEGARILKGVTIESGNVVGLNSIITKSILNKNSIVVGNNKIIKTDIKWEKDYIKNKN